MPKIVSSVFAFFLPFFSFLGDSSSLCYAVPPTLPLFVQRAIAAMRTALCATSL
jgi:hypothetical protein